MDKLKSAFSLLFWPLIGLGAMIIVWFLPWRFQVNDDVIMMWLLSGAYTGEVENYAVFIHPALSGAISLLYEVFGFGISWYAICWFLAVYYSFLLIHLRIQNSILTRHWRFFFNLFTLAISIHFCIFPQFTLVSGFLGIAAWVFVFQERVKVKLIHTILFWLAVSLSILIRAEAFLLVSVGVIFYFFVLKLNFRAHRNLFLLVSTVFTLLLCTKVLIEQNSKYAEYLEFNELRHQVIDHPVFYEKAKDKEFKKDEKWHFFSNWFFQNSEVQLEDMRAKKQLLDKEYFSSKYISKSFSRYWEVQTAELFKGFFTVILLLLFVGLYRKDQKLLFMLIWLSLFFLANHIFHFRGRVVFLFFIVLLFPVLQADMKKIPRRTPVILTISIFLVMGVHVYNFWFESKKREKILNEYAQLAQLSGTDELLMLEGLPLEYFSKYYNRENQVPFLFHGWISRSPFQDKALNRFGYTSLKEVQKFDLIAVKEKAPFYTKDFMSSIGGDFILEERVETETLVLFKYNKDLLK